MNKQKNKKESEIDLSKFFQRKEGEEIPRSLEPSERGGIKRFWQEMDEKTRFYIYLTIIIVFLTFTVFLLKSFFGKGGREITPEYAPPAEEEYIPTP